MGIDDKVKDDETKRWDWHQGRGEKCAGCGEKIEDEGMPVTNLADGRKLYYHLDYPKCIQRYKSKTQGEGGSKD